MKPQSTTTQKLSLIYLYNDIGKLNSNFPFLLFGPQPSIGSYLNIGSSEWLNKAIIRITINIKWLEDSLPKNFSDYYKEYTVSPVYTNTIFKVNCSILQNNHWHLQNIVPLNLFEENENYGTILPTSTFQLEVNKDLFIADTSSLIENLRQNQSSGDGYIRIELVAPDEAFGYRLYPTIFTNYVMEDSKGHKTDMPSQPYSPMVKEIDVSMTFGEAFNNDPLPLGGVLTRPTTK